MQNSADFIFFSICISHEDRQQQDCRDLFSGSFFEKALLAAVAGDLSTERTTDYLALKPVSAGGGASEIFFEILAAVNSVVSTFCPHAFLCPRGTKRPGAAEPARYGVLARLREELVQLWPGPVTKVSGRRQVKQRGSESALCGDREEPRPARYAGSDGSST